MAGILAMSFILSSCGSSSEDTIKIGSIHPITGSMAEAGQALVNAQQVAIDEINEKGGVNGKKLELVVIDSKGSASAAASGARKLINQGIVALTGAYTSGSSQAISQEAERGETPFVVTVAASADLLSRGYEYSFRIQPSVTTFSKDFIDYFTNYIRENDDNELKTCVLIYENSNYGAGIADYMKEHIDEAGLEIVGDIPYSSSTATLSSEVTKIEALSPDVLVTVGYKNDQTLLVNELLSRDVKLKAVIGIGNGAFSDPEFVSSYGDKINGYIDINYRYNSNSPNTDYLTQTYLEKFGKEMQVAGIYGYESIKVIAEGLKEAKSEDRKALRDAISQLNISEHVLPQPYIAFDETGEDIYAAGVMVQVQDGELVVLYPEEYADENAEYIPLT